MYLAGILFGIVPITLSMFGLIARALKDFPVSDPELVGATLVLNYLPPFASLLFFVMMLAGLAST